MASHFPKNTYQAWSRVGRTIKMTTTCLASGTRLHTQSFWEGKGRKNKYFIIQFSFGCWNSYIYANCYSFWKKIAFQMRHAPLPRIFCKKMYFKIWILIIDAAVAISTKTIVLSIQTIRYVVVPLLFFRLDSPEASAENGRLQECGPVTCFKLLLWPAPQASGTL